MSSLKEQELARLLVTYSVELQKGENCLINAMDVPPSMIEHLIEAVYEAGGNPLVNMSTIGIERALIGDSTQHSLQLWADIDAQRMARMDAFIGIRGIVNPREMANVQQQYHSYMHLYDKPVHHDIRIPKTKWVVLRYPTQLMAYQAQMSTKEFEDFFYRVTVDVDYRAMDEAMQSAKAFLDRTDQVHIIGPKTDITFSIKGMGSVICAGKRNIPDGEIYSCPHKESVEGIITYNTPSTFNGHQYNQVQFVVRKGKIVEATGDDSEKLNAVLDTDEGARYFGEFSFGCNPRIHHPMDNTLFDEKIAGSIHLTPGNAYQECDNGNRSAVHWDLVQIQTPQYGGGEIYLDGVLVRKDGRFVHPAFAALNFA
ncbi:MAG: aminopeptidase [Sphaerochaetaceae bacterium]|jgi:aminopeptidase